MRKKASPREKAKPVSVGFYPSELVFLQARADVFGSVSRYLRLLSAYDRKHNLMAAMLKAQAQELTDR